MHSSIMSRVVFLCENYVIVWRTKKEELYSMERIWAACHGKAIWGPSDATWARDSQHLKRGKIYSLSTFVCYPIQAAILLHNLLLDLSSWDKDRTPHHFFLSLIPPLWYRTHGPTPYLPNFQISCCALNVTVTHNNTRKVIFSSSFKWPQFAGGSSYQLIFSLFLIQATSRIAQPEIFLSLAC